MSDTPILGIIVNCPTAVLDVAATMATENALSPDAIKAEGSITGSGMKEYAQNTPEDLRDDIVIDGEAEKKLLRKLDLWIVPPVMLLYLLSFLDRVNIGNARLYDMEEDLGLKGDQYQIAVSVLFITYILSELPSNLVIQKFKPSRWLSFITFGWGVVATCTGLVPPDSWHAESFSVPWKVVFSQASPSTSPCSTPSGSTVYASDTFSYQRPSPGPWAVFFRTLSGSWKVLLVTKDGGGL